MSRSTVRVRLAFIEAEIAYLRLKVGEMTPKEIAAVLEDLERKVRSTHADFVEEEVK